MTPRQPYRSPFWRPETTPLEAVPQVSHATRASPSMRHAERPPPAIVAKRLDGPNNASGYAASDLALFNTLMPTPGQSEPRQAMATGPRSAAPRPSDAAQPERGRPVGVAGSRTYSDTDHVRFLQLQASFADIRSGLHPAESYQPSAVSAGATRGYSQQDLEAFERLTRFGAAW